MRFITRSSFPLCRVLAEMELAGVRVDAKALADFGAAMDAELKTLEERIYEEADGSFNINSPKQLGEVLFDRLGLPHGKKTKTGWSTNADVLEKLRWEHPIVADVLQYRQYAKLKSTYCDGLLKVIGPDGRVRTSFQMTVTATGRLSSTEPNLQNIPTRTPLGSELRRMFVPERGNVLVDADYSQIELRLLAHIAGDETMRQAFLSGEDIHTVTASQVFGVPTEAVTKQMRSHAKAVNFGIVYGISAFSLAQDIGVSVYEAKEYIQNYLDRFSGVRRYMTEIVEKAKAQGYVETLMHRRRDLPELTASNFATRSFGERVALNMPIQGTAADVMKLAMVRVHDRLRREAPEAKLLLQVHDELIVECPEALAEQAARLLTEEMEGVMSALRAAGGGGALGQKLAGGKGMNGKVMPVRIVPMKTEHLDAVAELERSCFTVPWSRNALAEELDNALSAFLVALDENDRVVGYAGLQVVLDEGYITNVAVRPDCRRRGVAGKLLDVFERFAEGNHLAFLSLEVRASNYAAIALYGQHGYRGVGRRRNYYEHPKEDAVIMTREFGEAAK